MSGSSTIRFIRLYISMAAPTLFLSSFFQSPPINFHSSEEVEFDIVRTDEEVAIVIQDLSAGHRFNSGDIYTNKNFKPPILKEAMALNSFDLIKRSAGSNPFEDVDFRSNIMQRAFTTIRTMENKIRRTMELQASQVLQTGIITLIDSNGVALYTLDFKPKSTHFTTSGSAWDTGTPDIQGDINSLAEVVRNDGLEDPNQLLFGAKSWIAFVNDPTIQALADNRRLNLIAVDPMRPEPGKGASFMGIASIGNYRYDLWTYSSRFINPQTLVKTQFIEDTSCIVRVSGARLDATFGNIPNIGRELNVTGPALLPELPGRISNGAGAMDLFTNAWLTEGGEQLMVGVGARPLMIPTAIDTFGNIDTQVT